MKQVCIIGTGLSGLRAALRFIEAQDVHVTMWEKSPSVGGRVATRRFGEQFVNHGATEFHDQFPLLQEDSIAEEFRSLFDFTSGATRLPKAMRARLEVHSEKMSTHFGARITSVSPSGIVQTETGETFHYDHVLLTAPMEQNRALLRQEIFPEVNYSKKILFIGISDGIPVRRELSDIWSEIHFELTDERITQQAQVHLGENLVGLSLKKWRYSQVTKGLASYFGVVSPKITVCGDAFDPKGIHRASAAWMSGLKASEHILKESL